MKHACGKPTAGFAERGFCFLLLDCLSTAEGAVRVIVRVVVCVYRVVVVVGGGVADNYHYFIAVFGLLMGGQVDGLAW